MLLRKYFLLTFAVLVSAACGFLIGQQNVNQTNAQNEPKSKNTKSSLPELLKNENISEVKTFLGEDDKTFYAVIQKLNEKPDEKSTFETSEKLSIFNEDGEIVYEHKDFEIGAIRFSRLLAPDSREMIFETNGGGTDNFLKILSLKNGKFTEIIDETETQMRGGYFNLIQYRTGMKKPYFQPSQLVVIGQIGGADENPTASVFRTVNKKFKKVGEIEMQKLGDFIEQQIVKR